MVPVSFNVGELVALLRLDTSDYDAAIARARTGASNTGQDIGRGLNQGTAGANDLTGAANRAGAATRGVGTSAGLASRAFATMGGIIAGAGVVSYITGAINASSDLNETMSKSAQIFGASAKSVETWGSTASKSVGLSKAAALEAAANFGNMFSQIGYTGDAAAELSMKVVQMSADLGSFNNLPTADVADKIAGAFNGEFDSLQALIPNINAARVETEALTATGKASADQLTQQEKVTAVLAIVNADGAKAMGDFARTSDGFANQSKITAAAIEDQKAALGDKLMPVVQMLMGIFSDVGIPVIGLFGDALGMVAVVAEPVVKALSAILGWVTDLPAPVLAAAAAFVAFSLLSGPVAGLGLTMAGLTTKIKAMALALKALLLNPVGIAVAAIAAAIAIFASSSADAAEATDAWNGKMADLKGTLDQVTGAVTAATKQKLVDQVGTENLARWKELGVDIGQATDAMAGNKEASDKNAASILGLTTKALEADSRFQRMAGTLAKAGVSSEEFARALMNGNLDEISQQLAAIGVSAEAGAFGAIHLKDASHALVGGIDSTTGASGELISAYHLINGEQGLLSASQQALTVDNEALAGATDKTAKATEGAVGPTEDIVSAWDDGAISASELTEQVDAVMRKVDELAGRNGDAEAAQRSFNSSLRDYADSLLGAGKEQRDLQQSEADLGDAQRKRDEIQNKATDSTWSAEQKQRDLEQANRDVADAEDAHTEALNAQGTAADSNAEKADDLRANMVTLAQQAYNTAVSQGNLSGAHEAAARAAQTAKDAFIKTRSAADQESGAAQTLADKLFGIPNDVATQIALSGGGAALDVANSLKAKLDQIDGLHATASVTLAAKVSAIGGTTVDMLKAALGFGARAAGGPIFGPGGPTEDRVPIMASAGEHMWTAAETRAAGGHAAVEGLRRSALSGSMGRRGFASGGAVMASMPVARVFAAPSVSASSNPALDVRLDSLARAINQLSQQVSGPRVVQLAGGDVNVVEADGSESLDSKLFRLAASV